MDFRTVGAIAALLVGLVWPDSQPWAQYYPPQPSAPLRPTGNAAQPITEQEFGLRPLIPIGLEPNVTGTLGGNPRSHMAALPPDVRPETGPVKELPPQFRRRL